MLFSSLVFLFVFLPLVLACTWLLRGVGWRNVLLLAASLFFYAWGELSYLWLILLMILGNYVLAMAVESARLKGDDRAKNGLLSLAIVANIGTLVWFKYADFLVGNINWFQQSLLHSSQSLPLPHVTLPLGISFLTFHCLSYVIDVFRGVAVAQRNLVSLGLYMSLFPQLIAGPIIRYHEIYQQLSDRQVTADKFARGINRFVVGLGKKMLVANAVAGVADAIFNLQANELSMASAWLGALCYTLQIYFDFSGYSDMAIGLGLMFGFEFPENFSFPYIAQSIQEFWRRWHLSLSRWFRDYLYIPLGGNRFGSLRTCLNLLVVFFLCGLWHGASWTFVAWGLYHGAFLGMERLGLGTVLEKLWRPLRHGYAMLVVMVGWVIFRADSLPQALSFLSAMFGVTAVNPSGAVAIEQWLDGKLLFFVVFGLLASTPLFHTLLSMRLRPLPLLPVARLAGLAAVLFLAIAEMASGSYSPFIYFRF